MLSNLFDYDLFINMYIIYNILKDPSFDFFNALIVSLGLSIFGIYEKILILSTFFWIYSNYNPTFILNRINRFNVIKKSFKIIDNDELYKTNKIFYYINHIENNLNKTINYIDTFINANINIFNKLRISNKVNDIYVFANNKIDIYIDKFINTSINIYNNVIYNIIDTSKRNKFTIIKKEMEEFRKLKEELDIKNNVEADIDISHINPIDPIDSTLDNNMKDVENLLKEIKDVNINDVNKDLEMDNKNTSLDFLKNINFDKMMKEIIYLKDAKFKKDN